MKKTLLFLLALTYLTSTRSQVVQCYFDSLMLQDTVASKNAYQLQKTVRTLYPPSIFYGKVNTYKRSGTPLAKYIIPIVVHVVYSATNSATNISEAQIRHQIDILNKAMKDSSIGIQFCFATKKTNGDTFNGILRYNTGNTIRAYNTPGGLGQLMTTYQFDPEKYLNIYVVPGIFTQSNIRTGITGVGTPKTANYYHPGIVMSYDFFGSFLTCGSCTLDSTSDGNIMVHETGHYFGLYHTFEGKCTNGGMTNSTCSIQGDLCCDTRPEDGPHWICNQDTNTCNENNDSNDNQNNFMSYRECWSEFTSDQKKLMNATIQSNYVELTEATNIIAAAPSCLYHTALFSADRLSACDTGTFVFTALYSSGTVTYEWKVINELSQTEYFTNKGNKILAWKAMSPGKYTIILTTIDGQEKIIYTRTKYVSVSDCKTKIQSSNGNWYFGTYAGMNFSSTSPVIDDLPRRGANDGPTIDVQSSSLSQSSSNGRILFYGGSNGNNKYQLFNKLHNKLKNGDSAWIDRKSKHGLLCIPRPGANNGKHFYILSSCSGYFTNIPPDKTNGLFYSILDTSLDGGNGGIDLSNRNKPVLPPTGSKYHYPGNTALWSTESLVAIPKCGTLKEYWLITQAGDSIQKGLNSKFFIYSVQSGGIFFDHMDSCAASCYSTENAVASPDGRWIMAGGVLFTFDRANGRLKQQRVLRTGQYGESCLFSSNSKVLYYWDDINGILKQIDLTIELRPDINIYITNRPLRSMQMGPDNKIYLGNYGTNFLSIINYPNNLNTISQPNACGFEEKGFYTKQNGKGGIYIAGLPKLIHAKPQSELTGEIIAVRTACKTVKFTTNLCCDDNFVWDYGDGSSSGSGLDVTHTYTNKGKYIVSLTSNNFGSPRVLYDTIKIGIDTSVLAIDGSLSICDTMQKANYYNPKFNGNIAYSWSALHGTLASANGLNSMDVLWNGNGLKKITLKATSFEGCVDSISKTVLSRPQVKTNTISMKNKYCGTDTIFGSTPTGGNGVYRYKWRKRLVGTQTWLETNVGDTFKNLFPTTVTDPIEYMRLVYSNATGTGGGCFYQTNIIRITPFSNLNSIGINTSLCGIISQGSNLDSITGMTYQWQRSTDGTTWSDVSGQTGKHINQGSSLGSFYFYRRKAYIGSCISYSNIIFAGGNKVKIQPKTIKTCSNQLSSYKFDFTLEDELDSGCTFKWEYNAGSGWIGLGDERNRELFASTAYSYSHTAYFRCVITTHCNIISTSGAQIKLINILDTILTQPNKNNTLNQGNNLNLICKVTRDSNQNYQWQSSHNSGVNWFDMKGRNDDTLKLLSVNYCQNNKTYRVVITNKCGNVLYTDTANVKVNNLTSITQDYWMKDQWGDIGTEKNPSTERPVLSPDIFIANTVRTTKPKKLDFSPNYLEKNNYVHAMVRNKGTTTASGGKLYLYWTLAATGEKWPLNWSNTSGNKHWNPDSAHQPSEGYYPMGGPINAEAINLSSIGSGDSQIVSFLWKNVPNPNWYYPLTPRGNVYSKKINVCVLARIETCEESTFGMKFPEVESTHGNAANNNNIATRNLWVIYMFPDITDDDDQSGGDGPLGEFKIHVGNRPLIKGGLTWVRNMDNTTVTRDICINISSSAYLTKADMYIKLNEKLVNAWVTGGKVSTNLQRIGDNVFKVLGTSACLKNVVTEAGFVDGFTTYFSYKNIDNRFTNSEKYAIYVDQYDGSGALEGSVGYEIRDNVFVPPTVITSSQSISSCSWTTPVYTHTNPLPYTIKNLTTNTMVTNSIYGIYNLTPATYLVKSIDQAYDNIFEKTLTVSTFSPDSVTTRDTISYDCATQASAVGFSTSWTNAVMKNRSGATVTPTSPGNYTLNPHMSYYVLYSRDTANCKIKKKIISFKDQVVIPSTNYNTKTGHYNRTVHNCCFVEMGPATCPTGKILANGQTIKIFDLSGNLLTSTTVTTFRSYDIGFFFCPPKWNTSPTHINDAYNVVFNNDTCKYCKLNFHCDSFIYVINDLTSGEDSSENSMKVGIAGLKDARQSFKAYPNPASSTITVEWNVKGTEPFKVNICDIVGKVVYSTEILPRPDGTYKLTIPLLDQSNGVYSVQVTSGEFRAKSTIVLIKR